MIPWDLHLFGLNRAEKADIEARACELYSNKMFLFGPAAWGGQNFCDREQGFLRSRDELA
jgi:hypothetical protein